MIPLRPRYARIDRLVSQLLERISSDEPPIPLEQIVERVGASIVYERFDDDISGVLIRNEGYSVIGVQKSQSLVRQRFTIAHELGHFLLHDGKPIRVDKSFRVNWRKERSSDSRDVEEVEANAFAAKLLMPKHMIERVHGVDSFELEDDTEVARLAELFRVSKQAMNFRLNQLFANGALAE